MFYDYNNPGYITCNLNSSISSIDYLVSCINDKANRLVDTILGLFKVNSFSEYDNNFVYNIENMVNINRTDNIESIPQKYYKVLYYYLKHNNNNMRLSSESDVLMNEFSNTKNKTISKIVIEDKQFELVNPLICKSKCEENYHILEYEPLGIEAIGKDEQDVLEKFSEEFYFLWKNYAMETDENLTKKAIILKELLKSIVKRSS